MPRTSDNRVIAPDNIDAETLQFAIDVADKHACEIASAHERLTASPGYPPHVASRLENMLDGVRAVATDLRARLRKVEKLAGATSDAVH